jgi:hypothetical protein
MPDLAAPVLRTSSAHSAAFQAPGQQQGKAAEEPQQQRAFLYIIVLNLSELQY